MSQKENSTKFAILGMLTWQKMSGYDIKKVLNEMVNHIWSVSFGQIYPLLKTCEAEGLVKKEFLEQEGKPDKNIYSITKKGLEKLQEWLQIEVGHTNIRSELLLKIAIGSHTDISIVKKHISDYKNLVTEKIILYTGMIKHKEIECEDKKELVCIEIIADYMITHLKNELEWCERSIKKLKLI